MTHEMVWLGIDRAARAGLCRSPVQAAFCPRPPGRMPLDVRERGRGGRGGGRERDTDVRETWIRCLGWGLNLHPGPDQESNQDLLSTKTTTGATSARAFLGFF